MLRPFWFEQRAPASTAWQGYVEADYVKVSPTQQGRLTAVSVARGDTVAAGAPFFGQDDTADRAARDQAARQLAQAEDQLANLQAGGKPTEIRQALANLADTRAALVRTGADYRRGQAMLVDGGVSVQSVDLLRADYQSAAAKGHGGRGCAHPDSRSARPRREIKAQMAAADAAGAALEGAEWRLAQRHVTAPAAGRVADVLARPGEDIPAGTPVVSLLAPENIFVRFFVPETALATIHPGDRVALACDACPGDLSATVSFISPQAISNF